MPCARQSRGTRVRAPTVQFSGFRAPNALGDECSFDPRTRHCLIPGRDRCLPRQASSCPVFSRLDGGLSWYRRGRRAFGHDWRRWTAAPARRRHAGRHLSDMLAVLVGRVYSRAAGSHVVQPSRGAGIRQECVDSVLWRVPGRRWSVRGGLRDASLCVNRVVD
jgi:hypothetical protein